jgi:hypothetical protein
VRLGSDGLLRLVVMGDGTLVVPVDFTVRRPDPQGLGRPCRDKRTWRRVRLDRTWTARLQRCRPWPSPVVVADSWCGDSGLMAPVATAQRGTLLVEGKTSDVFTLPAGGRVKGQDLLTRQDWPWREDLHLPGVRYARLTVTSPTSGWVTVVIVAPPGRDRDYLLCRETSFTAPRLIRAWRRRSGIAQAFRTLKHLRATEACQVQTEAAYYGHLVLRLMAALVLLSTSRVLFKGQVTREDLVVSRKHHWRFLESDILE